MRKIPELVEIENNRIFTQETNRNFYDMLQKCLLLSLKDSKILTTMQYRYAEEKMHQQKLKQAKTDVRNCD